MDGCDENEMAKLEWLKEPEGSEPVTVAGVVSAHGPSCGRSYGENYWTLSIKLDAYRIAGGPVQEEQLWIQLLHNFFVTGKLSDRIGAGEVIQAKVRLVKPRRPDFPDAFLAEYHGIPVDDADLKEISRNIADARSEKQEKACKEYFDEQFGTFTFENDLYRFRCDSEWQDKKLTLTLQFYDEDEQDEVSNSQIKESLKTARDVWMDLDKWNAQSKKFAFKELAPIVDEDRAYNGEDAEVTEEEFFERMELFNIDIYPNGEFYLYFGEDAEFGLFGDHFLSVIADLENGPTSYDIS